MRLLLIATVVLLLGTAPGSAASERDRSGCRDASKDPDSRLAACTRIIEHFGETDHDKFMAHVGRARANHLKGDFDRAIADYTEAIRLTPEYASGYNSRGIAYGKKGNHQKAIADFTTAIRLNGLYANAHSNRGIAHANVGEFTQAIADIQAAIRLAKDNPRFHNELAWTYYRSGKAAAGLPYVDHALSLSPDYANAYDTRGSIYEALGENAKAIADFKRALSLDPSLTTSTEALWRLAQSAGFASFLDVVHLVQERGWQVDLGSICTEFQFVNGADNCTFKQLSVQEPEGRGDPRGFNVSVPAPCRSRKSHPRGFAPEGESGQHHIRCLPSSTCL